MTNFEHLEIPEKLRKDNFRFIRLEPHSKKPIDTDWQNTNNFRYDDPILLKHIENGGNYGVVCGFGYIVVIDADTEKVWRKVQETLPPTFTVKSGSSKKDARHLYYVCPDMDRPIRLRKEKSGDIGDVQWKGKQIVGPNCIHPDGNPYTIINDIEIAEVKAEQIRFAIHEFAILQDADENLEKGKIDLKITDVMDINSLKSVGSQYQGSHPIHGSDNGLNFCVNEEKNVWHCFRCNSGGGPLTWIAVMEGIIQCHEAVKGGLRGDLFLKALDIAKQKYGLVSGDSVQVEMPRRKLKISGEHLPFFKEFDEAIGLFGPEYGIYTKGTYYSSLGLITQKSIELSRIRTDTRQPCLFVLPSGRGKNNFTNFLFSIASKLGLKYQGPVSYHPEMLPGKMLKRGTARKPEYVPNLGYLADDLCVLNEAYDLFSEADTQAKQGMKYIRMALDPIGYNKVVKDSVDNLRGLETIHYPSKVTVNPFIQPFPLHSAVVENGDLRRFLVLYEHIPRRDRNSEYRKKVYDKTDDKPMNSIIQFLRDIKNHSAKITLTNNLFFTEEAKEAILFYHKSLLEQGRSFSKRGGNFMDMIEWPYLDKLTSFSAINALANKQTEVDKGHVKSAFLDLAEFLESILKFVEEKIQGRIDYSSSSKQVVDVKYLDWLLDNGATSEETGVQISDFVKHIQLYRNVKEDRAEKIVSFLKFQGVIQRAQTGTHTTSVWCTKEGLELLGHNKPQYFDFATYDEIKKILETQGSRVGGSPPEEVK